MEVTLERVPQYEEEDRDMGGREGAGQQKWTGWDGMLCPMRWKTGKKESGDGS